MDKQRVTYLISESGVQETNFLHRIRVTLRFYSGIENIILPMLSYPERQVTSSCELAS